MSDAGELVRVEDANGKGRAAQLVIYKTNGEPADLLDQDGNVLVCDAGGNAVVRAAEGLYHVDAIIGATVVRTRVLLGEEADTRLTEDGTTRQEESGEFNRFEEGL